MIDVSRENPIFSMFPSGHAGCQGFGALKTRRRVKINERAESVGKAKGQSRMGEFMQQVRNRKSSPQWGGGMAKAGWGRLRGWMGSLSHSNSLTSSK